jgi:hypothetical protein
MSEKIESMEIHPMRGHSRGDWYCSLDDIAPSEAEAEYWAIFGVTHRGNRHCLGEFPTKAAATTAAKGLEAFHPRPAQRLPARGLRVTQIEVLAEPADDSMIQLFALCEDGSIWRRGVGVGPNANLMDDRWEQIPPDGMENVDLELARVRNRLSD